MKQLIYHIPTKTAWISTTGTVHKISKDILAYYMQHNTLKMIDNTGNTLWFNIT